MSVIHKLKRAVRGEVKPGTVALELMRRSGASIQRWSERPNLERNRKQAARLKTRFARMDALELTAYFRDRPEPHFLPGLSQPLAQIAGLQQNKFPVQTKELITSARRIVDDHRWPLLGLGERHFGVEIEWCRDPLSGVVWPLKYHRDIQLTRTDGSDVRVLWELNRLGHLITLARAYATTKDESLSAEFFKELQSWCAQNPVGLGPNWSCAMEVALRAMNLLGAFEIFRCSPLLEAQSVALVLTTLDQHGGYIRRNLEFSYLATSNHYLSDVVGLLWLGIMLPELRDAEQWRAFGLREVLREMDKQVLNDGADFEASTGYHRFVLELFLYSFILCRSNGIEVGEKHWSKLHSMLEYLRAYLRPDGGAPLIGDSDGGQVFPIRHRIGTDHGYLAAVGAALFNDGRLKLSGSIVPEEVFWILGEEGVRSFEELNSVDDGSRGFPDAGTYVLRQNDLYLLFNASGSGIQGRGSHGHNDSLSVEVSACGRAFLVDPGSYVYTADLQQRHIFRSTAYHSTVEVDTVDQNTINVKAPFVIGDEARPRVVLWETGAELDRVIAEHSGYARLLQPITHRRTVSFDKRKRWWLIEDDFLGSGSHIFAVRFHFDAGLDVSVYEETSAMAYEQRSGAKLLVLPLDAKTKPECETQFTSSDYCEKRMSIAARWSVSGSAPCSFRWAIVPVCSGENEAERLASVARLISQSSSRN